MASLSRTITLQIISNIAALIIIVAIISALLVFYSQTTLQGIVVEMVQDFARQLAKNPTIPPDQRQQLVNMYQQSLMVRFGLVGNPLTKVYHMMINIFTLNLGNSRQSYMAGTTSISGQVIFALKNTVILFLTATLISTLLGLGLGMYAARRPHGIIDSLVSFFAILSSSLPMWWVGMLMLLAFAFDLHWFPTQSLPVYFAIQQLHAQYASGAIGFFTYVFDYIQTWLYYMTLPLITVVLVSIGGWAYIVRNVVIGKMAEDFVMTARAKGVPERRVLFGHVLRAASPPIVTTAVLNIIVSLGGAIITETVFGWPGMGLLFWIAIENSEPMLIAGNVYITVLLFIIAVIILNILYVFLDPRVKTSGGQQIF
ncbi:ABC transporter permease [Fervidicoccus fontis]|uniref:ABC transporter permease n=1 Tax=Fervidicoccus fontis TaxID=683846 RepID=A0A843ACM7_9CREN|nr:ABC transporter permease [Fervidicoccus fontis]MBE9391754.1 ABC transporter permease [Fervidicoccus fontis]